MDEDLVYSDIGDENFFQQANTWKPDAKAPVRQRAADRVREIAKLPKRGKKIRRGGRK